MAIRVVQGLVSGFAFPSIYAFVAVWTSPGERATLMSLAFSGIRSHTNRDMIYSIVYKLVIRRIVSKWIDLTLKV